MNESSKPESRRRGETDIIGGSVVVLLILSALSSCIACDVAVWRWALGS